MRALARPPPLPPCPDSGTIDASELRAVLKALGHRASQREVEALMELMKEEQARGNTDAAVRQRC